MIPELRYLSYDESLKECGFKTKRRLRGSNQTEVSKILSGYENIDRNMLFLRNVVELEGLR